MDEYRHIPISERDGYEPGKEIQDLGDLPIFACNQEATAENWTAGMERNQDGTWVPFWAVKELANHLKFHLLAYKVDKSLHQISVEIGRLKENLLHQKCAGEFICKKCGLRQEPPPEEGEPEF